MYVEYEADGKTIKARVMQKTDTLANWEANPLPLLAGEQAFVVDSAGNPVNFKIGDGTKRFSELPWWIKYDQGQFVTVAGTVMPEPENDVAYSWLTEGTYTQPSGPNLVVPAGYFGLATWNKLDTSWSLTTQELPIAPVDGLLEKGGYEGTAQDLDDRIDEIETSPSKAKDWSSGTYTANQTAVKDGVLYRVKPSVATTTGEPGVSSDWEPIDKATNFFVKTENLYNPNDPANLTDRILGNGGGTTALAGYVTSGWIPVVEGELYTAWTNVIPEIVTGNYRYYFYSDDVESSRIGSTFSTLSSGQTSAAPTGARYLRISVPTSVINNYFILANSSVSPEEYIFPGYTLGTESKPVSVSIESMSALKYQAAGRKLVSDALTPQSNLFYPRQMRFLNASINLYNPNSEAIVKEAYINALGNYMASGSPTQQVAVIPCKPNTQYSFYNTVALTRVTPPINILTTGGNISVPSSEYSAIGYYTTPSNATHIRVTTSINAVYYTVVEGENPPATFQDYGYSFTPDILVSSGNAFPWEGKSCGFLGDSITVQFLYGATFLQTTRMTEGYRHGQNGQVIAAMGNELTPENIASLDIITVLAGTNDYSHGPATLGDINSPMSNDTIYGSVKLVADRILSLKPNVRLVFFTPFNRGVYSGSGNGYMPNINGLTIKNISEAILDCCQYLGIPAFDLLTYSGINAYNLTTHCPDNLHPGSYGGGKLGQLMGKFVNTLIPF